jgi:putative tricarboxylic transport membrane protein
MMGALIIHGVQPGPTLMAQHPDIFWGVIASFYIGNVMLLVLNLPLIGIWVQFLRIPYWALFPIILLLCIVGTFSANLNIFDVWVMIAFGVLAYLLRKRNYELGPFILALILGPMFEQALRQSLIMSHRNPMTFLARPISGTLLGISLVLLVLFFISVWRKGKKAQLFEAPKE